MHNEWLKTGLSRNVISLERDLMKAIYLDLNFWILIGDESRSGFNNPEIKNFYLLLKELVHNGKIICPVSNALFIELFKQTNPDSRLAIASIMDELSKGKVIEMIYLVMKQEMISTIDFSNSAKKPSSCVWATTRYLRDLKRNFLFINSMKGNRSYSFEEIINKIKLENYKDFLDQISNITNYLQEKKLDHQSEVGSFKLLQAHEITCTVDAVFTMFPELKARINSEQQPSFSKEDKIYELMPTLWAHASIHALLRYDKGRKYKDNDFFDREHCSLAIGYYDYLFTEKSFYYVVTNKLADLNNQFNLKCAMNIGEATKLLINILKEA